MQLITKEQFVQAIQQTTNFNSLAEAREKGFVVGEPCIGGNYACQVDCNGFEWVELYFGKYYGSK